MSDSFDADTVPFKPLNFTRNDYFTYFTDGNTQGTHRTSAQIWTVNFKGDGKTYIIHVAGPNPQGGHHPPYNSFAKRHLLTFQGGKSHDDGYENPVPKLNNLHFNRQWENIDGYTHGRAKQQAGLAVPNQAQYEPGALGPKNHTAPLTVVICDEVSPDELRLRFAAAMYSQGKQTPWQAGQAQNDVRVKFQTECVWGHDYGSNTITKKNWIDVTVFCQAIAGNTLTMHVVHLSR